jgi:hypothetical protein
MKSVAAKSIPILLTLIFLAAALAPACAGSENCSMPCCRPKAQPASHPAAEASGGACCPQPADDAAGRMSGCRFVKSNAALPSAAETGPGPTAALGYLVFDHPIARPGAAPGVRSADSGPPGTPIYLRLQTLLI